MVLIIDQDCHPAQPDNISESWVQLHEISWKSFRIGSRDRV
jgi:hypothetical protein